MANVVYKAFDGKQWRYSYDEQLYRKSKKEFKYACIAFYDGKTWVLSLGNDKGNDLPLKGSSLRPLVRKT